MLTKVPRVTLGRAQRAFWPHGGAMRATPATQKMQAMGRNFWTFVFPTHPAVKFTMGNYSGVVKEGLRLKIPYIHRFVRVDVRTQVKDIPVQKFLTKGGVTITVDAKLQFRVVDPKNAILEVSDVNNAVLERAALELRKVIGSYTLDELLRLEDRNKVTTDILAQLRHLEAPWGIKFDTVQIRDLGLDPSMLRAYAVEEEARQNAKAKVINAKADVKTAREYSHAAKIYAENPLTMRLREFQLWQNVSQNPGCSVYVVPSDLLNRVSKLCDTDKPTKPTRTEETDTCSPHSRHSSKEMPSSEMDWLKEEMQEMQELNDDYEQEEESSHSKKDA